MSDDTIGAAQARADRARVRLTDALTELKMRLMPGTLARNVAKGVADKSGDAARATLDAAKARPGVAVGAAALIGLFLARKPIGRAITGGDASEQNSAPEETPAKPARSPAKPA